MKKLFASFLILVFTFGVLAAACPSVEAKGLKKHKKVHRLVHKKLHVKKTVRKM